VLTCAVNVSEGRDRARLARLAGAASGALLDLHADAHHHRAVLTLGGAGLQLALRDLCRVAVAEIDIAGHRGAHPRLGAVDVVPFAAHDPTSPREAMAWRDEHARWMAGELGVPCFLYGPDRSLPELRREAFASLVPDHGPPSPHPTAGATCVGARPPLVAYNLWLAPAHDLADARRVARLLRSATVRALGLALGPDVQVSCNLLAPDVTGPDHVYDAVAAEVAIARAELVGLAPRSVLARIPRSRWAGLDLDEARTPEARLDALARRGPDPGGGDAQAETERSPG